MSKYFNTEKLLTNIENIVTEQLEDMRFESSAIFVGVVLGHAIKITVTRDEEEVADAEETLHEHPNFDCIQ